MFRRTGHAALASVLALITGAVPAVAVADPGASCDASPGNASVNQYCESVPAVGGPEGVQDATSPQSVSGGPGQDLSQSSGESTGVDSVAGAPGSAEQRADGAPSARADGERDERGDDDAAEREEGSDAVRRERGVTRSAAPQRRLSGVAVIGGIPPIVLLIAGSIVVAGVAFRFGSTRGAKRAR